MPRLLQSFNVGNEIPKRRAVSFLVMYSETGSGILKEGADSTSFFTVSEMTVTNSSNEIGENKILSMLRHLIAWRKGKLDSCWTASES